MSALKTTHIGYTTYRGSGHWSFILHRLTGLGTLLFLGIHILDTATVYFIPQLYEEAINLYRNPLFMLGEIGLVFCLFFHGLNGLRIAIFDLFMPGKWNIETQRKSALWILGIAIILWIPAAFMMGRALLVHNFGL